MSTTPVPSERAPNGDGLAHETAATPVPAPLPARCRCGFDRTHPMARAEPQYGFIGWLRLVVGVSARPDRVVYRCRRCGTVIEDTAAPEALDEAY
jgi:hypothetical protein